SQGQQGSIVWESENVPASWKAQADGAGDTWAPAANTAQPADGSAAADAAAGSAAPQDSTDAAPAPAAPAEPEVVASNDKLPEFGEGKKPNVVRHGPSPRQSNMEGIGTNKADARALFEELTPGMLAKQ